MKILTVFENIIMAFDRKSLIFFNILCFLWLLLISIFAIIDFDILISVSQNILSPDKFIENKQKAFLLLALGPFFISLSLSLSGYLTKRNIPVNNLYKYIGFFAFHLLICSQMDKFFGFQGGEDGLLENLTAIISFIAALIFIFCGFRGSKFAFFLSLCWFLFAMEEISWGQRILEFYTPEFFEKNNYQQETNIHNFFNPFLKTWAYFITNALLLLFFTSFSELKVFSKFYKLKSVSELIKISDTHSIWIIPLFLIYAELPRGQEIIEQQWSLLGLILSCLLFIKIKK
jgi:hypothetical protein